MTSLVQCGLNIFTCVRAGFMIRLGLFAVEAIEMAVVGVKGRRVGWATNSAQFGYIQIPKYLLGEKL